MYAYIYNDVYIIYIYTPIGNKCSGIFAALDGFTSRFLDRMCLPPGSFPQFAMELTQFNRWFTHEKTRVSKVRLNYHL